jgi:hypothetical protein
VIVRIKARDIFPNCPRYIHSMEMAEISEYALKSGYTPPEPFWKSKPNLKEYLPEK